MPYFKEVWQYTQVDRGFTEVYYVLATNLAQAALFPSSLIGAACQLRNQFTILRKVRVSDVLNNRSSVVVPFNRPGLSQYTGPDVVSTSAICTLNAPATGARRQVWFRGLSDTEVVRSPTTGLDAPAPSLLINMQSYIAELAAAQYQVQSLKKLGVAPLVYTPLLQITIAVPGEVTFFVPSTWAITPSGRVIISQLDNKLYPGLNGHWAAKVLSATSFSVRYNSHLSLGTFNLTKGRTRPEEYEYGPISRLLSGFNKFGSRDTGRSPLGGRGRRSTRIQRSA